ncbi:MAG TPA: hypothetical protein VM686_13270, partial [Polyangiaceae bacterium]|nr:hypothetical protein [Polyangiaceae bacterium]
GVVRDADSATTTGELGRDCITDAECGEGLICVTRDDVDTLGGAPPKGLCTAACPCEDGADGTICSDDPCLEFSANAYCIPFTAGDTGYCLEGCAFDQGLTPKCHDRIESVCTGVAFQELDTDCTDNLDCGANEACLSGVCNAVLTVCLPNCGSDADCDDGLFCDPLTGLCMEDPPTGKGVNEACDPAADPDECASGYCSVTYMHEDEGTCSGFCNLGHPFSCGYTGEGKADAACLFGTVLSGEASEVGDLGVCGQLCDCDDECTATGEVCRPFGDPVFEELWQRVGYCVPIVEGGTFTADDAIGPCGAGGGGNTGGAGGMPSGQSGAAGAPVDMGGAGGAPAAGAGGN